MGKPKSPDWVTAPAEAGERGAPIQEMLNLGYMGGEQMEDKGLKGTTLDDHAVEALQKARTKLMAWTFVPSFLLGAACGAALVWWFG
jgi:hypothetical protein